MKIVSVLILMTKHPLNLRKMLYFTFVHVGTRYVGRVEPVYVQQRARRMGPRWRAASRRARVNQNGVLRSRSRVRVYAAALCALSLALSSSTCRTGTAAAAQLFVQLLSTQIHPRP